MIIFAAKNPMHRKYNSLFALNSIMRVLANPINAEVSFA